MAGAINTYVIAGPKGVWMGGKLYGPGENINLTEEQAAGLADRLEAQNTPRNITPALTPEQQEEQARAEAKTVTASGKVEDSKKEKEAEADLDMGSRSHRGRN